MIFRKIIFKNLNSIQFNLIKERKKQKKEW